MSRVLPAISALGTTWLVEIFDPITEEQTAIIYDDCCLFLTDFEANYSRFKPDSIISTLNRIKILNQPDALTTALLTFGRNMYKETNGVFNILVGELLEHRGYDANYSLTPKSKEEPTPPSPLGALTITRDRITLSGGQIDLGGFAKGYAIDLLAKQLKEQQGLNYFLINGGGDMYATSDHGEPITIYLEHPTEPGTYVAETTLKDQGFAASSTHKRKWQVGGTEYSHIVDTRSKDPKRVVGKLVTPPLPNTLGIYTKAPIAAEADAWATTLLINPNSPTPPNVAVCTFNTTKPERRSSNF